jgi:hypothetical protein
MSRSNPKHSLLGAICLSMVWAAPGFANPDAESEAAAEAKRLVGVFVGQMKPLLQRSVAERGPADAIDVCAVEAPQLTESISAQSDWTVSRVSSKPRNGDRARADAWEARVLADFEERLASGEAAPGVNYGEVVNGEYRYMQAQAVEGVCLLCHGSNIDVAVRDAIGRHYPNDQATGYELGELRGAISLRKPLNSLSD